MLAGVGAWRLKNSLIQSPEKCKKNTRVKKKLQVLRDLQLIFRNVSIRGTSQKHYHWWRIMRWCSCLKNEE